MKAYKVKLNGKNVAVSGIAEPEVVNCVNLTHSKKNGKDKDILLSISGSYFEDDKQFSSTWYEPFKELSLGDKVEVEIVEVEVDKVDLPIDTTVFGENKSCTFCYKSHAEVECLFRRDSSRMICSECVEACMDDLKKRRQELKS